jgi:hypothetical protein
MKITRSQLKQLIKEELSAAVNEQEGGDEITAALPVLTKIITDIAKEYDIEGSWESIASINRGTQKLAAMGFDPPFEIESDKLDIKDKFASDLEQALKLSGNNLLSGLEVSIEESYPEFPEFNAGIVNLLAPNQ